jgi:hypothetical protein
VVEVHLLVEGIPTRHECAGVVSVEPDCGVEVGDGAVQVVLRQPHAAAVGKGPRVVGIEPDRRGEIVERAGEVAFGAHCHAPIVMQNSEIGRLVAAGIDQRRAGGNSLVTGGAPLPGAAALVWRCRFLRARRPGHDQQRGEGERNR